MQRSIPLHVVSEVLDPEHWAPPFLGEGLLQYLLLDFFPVVLTQDDHDDQTPQTPSRTHFPSVHDTEF